MYRLGRRFRGSQLMRHCSTGTPVDLAEPDTPAAHSLCHSPARNHRACVLFTCMLSSQAHPLQSCLHHTHSPIVPHALPACSAGLRPFAASRPVRAAARIVATAAPISTGAVHTSGNGATQPALPQTVIISEPVTVSGPVQIAGVLSPAAVYQAVSRAGLGGVAQHWPS